MVTLAEVKKFFEDQKADKEVVSYLEEFQKITPEKAETFLSSDEGKKILQSKLDSHFTKGLETWKAKTLPNVIEEEIKREITQKLQEIEEYEKTHGKNKKVKEKKTFEVEKVKGIKKFKKGMRLKYTYRWKGEPSKTYYLRVTRPEYDGEGAYCDIYRTDTNGIRDKIPQARKETFIWDYNTQIGRINNPSGSGRIIKV
jgi:hypothetical protein